MAPGQILETAGGTGRRARLLRAAVSRIAAYTLEHALLGELSHQMALAELQRLDGTPVETAGAIEITMDDAAERWSR